MLAFFKKADKAVEWTQVVVCSLLMVAIMALTFAMVFWRYVLNNSIVWAEEILRYLMMWAVLVGAGLTTREDQHVAMDVTQSILGRWPKVQAVHYVLTRLVVFLFMFYLAFPAMELVISAANSTATSVRWLPKSVIYFSFVCGCISINLSLLSQVPQKVYAIIHGIENADLIELKAQAAKFEEALAAEASAEETDTPENANDGGNAK